MSNKDRILSAIRACPGIGVAELADHFGMLKPNARRDALQLAAKGLVTARNDELGYSFYPVGEAIATPSPPGFPRLIGNSLPVIDGTFKDVAPSPWPPPASPSTSRALTVTEPADSRLQAALVQHEQAQRKQNTQPLVALPGGIVADWNQLFIQDPDGTASLASYYRAAEQRLRAQTEHEAWIRQEYTRRLQEQQEREAQEKKRRQDEKVHAAIQRMYGLDKDDEPPPRRRVNGQSLAHEQEPEPPVDRFRDRQRQEAETRPSPIAELFAKARTGPKTETQPQAEESSWWRRRFATPKRPVWR